ncbi:hypothetical protein MPTK1_6g13720 [Marchantia polymorpha subsp. ruderalis]|uniref:F-box domain-containing protein n=2 Tax=Marchantia polymorpha TaxID=3197 RepID=A0AAF6BRR6_MARPO|nr:hypothetical protein MARPO_0047s0023 [Marchantia polymorpha]BBN14700.1 hypothetical protein Mp_6g13720 [Marchantia polymorpha subsp. ruderalis]|eukprot:PTQ39030.1 hypothetical protein MARPO_0047s0023 [Marchantia polymorpha]
MEKLPDEIWSQILRNSAKREHGLRARDLCSFAIVSRRAKRISKESKIWRPMLERDFGGEYKASEERAVDPKASYMKKFEKRKAKREAERRLQIMRLESSVFSCEISIQNYKRKLMQEKAAAKAVAADIRLQLFAAQYTRGASVALRRWQPDAVSTFHQRVVQQVLVDDKARVNSLKNDLRERAHYVVSCERGLKKCEYNLKVLRQKLEELYYSPIDLSEDPISPKSLMLKSLVDRLSWREAKRSKLADQ